MPSLIQSGSELDLLPNAQISAGGASLASLFNEISARYNNRIAISAGAETVSYADLSAAASKVSAALLELNLQPDALVAIYLDRSIEMVIAMLGVIRAGAAYLPIDPTYPEARVRETLADASPVAVLTDSSRAGVLEGISTKIFLVTDLLSSHTAVHDERQPKPDDLAYVIYTSGSTGRPKGVRVTHRNVVRLFQQTQHWFNFNEHDVWTMFHSFAFDFSVWEIWGPLLSGGRLVIVPFAVSRSPEDFYRLLCDEGVTVLNQTPTAFSMLIQAESRDTAQPLALRLVILGGEALTLRSLLPWFARHSDAKPAIINMYGITETTVHVTYRRIRQMEAETETDSIIGEPIPDLSVHLLDDKLQHVPHGEVGEICVGGAGVAQGYLNRPELTDERFIPDPFGGRGARLYRSGDLARYRADGELVYLGRADRQVKINGFRVELGEVESVLASHPLVAQVSVAAHADLAAGQRLAAYFVPSDIDVKTLRQYADERLPVQMRPAFYMPMQSLPINVNGKIDRTALPVPISIAAAPAAKPGASAGRSLTDRIAAVWCEVLRIDAIDLNDNFFDVGGTSLLLVALRTELQRALNRTIPITLLFEHTTIQSQAAKLGGEGVAGTVLRDVAQEKAQHQRNSFARMRALRSTAR